MFLEYMKFLKSFILSFIHFIFILFLFGNLFNSLYEFVQYYFQFQIVPILPILSAQRCIFPGRYKDYTDLTNRQYYVCNGFDGTPILFRCPTNSIFIASTQNCVINESPLQVECSLIQKILGRMPDPNGNGTTYIDCTESSEPIIKTCSAGLFSPIYLCCFNANTCYI